MSFSPSRRRRVRLAAPTLPSPIVPGSDVAFARVTGARLAREGVRNGDHVLLARRASAYDGAIASVVDRTGRGSLWRVRHDRAALELFDGAETPAARTAPWPEVTGVVVAVLRRTPPRCHGNARERADDRRPAR
jgi:hypothetical protein